VGATVLHAKEELLVLVIWFKLAEDRKAWLDRLTVPTHKVALAFGLVIVTHGCKSIFGRLECVDEVPTETLNECDW
jgi:hypothetical protein